MDYQNVTSELARKSTKSFWFDLAQSAWLQSSGGNEVQSHLFAEAYTMGAMAASILDDVQDQDGQDALWQTIGTGPAIAIGVGLAFKTISALNLVGLAPVHQNRLNLCYAKTVDQMCQGQHRDLNSGVTPPTLNEAWSVVADKTGAWCAFGVSAYAEAVGTKQVEALKAIGHHIGCWHQIGNDLTSILQEDGKGDLLHRKHTVLSSYAFTVAEGAIRTTLEQAWQSVDALISVGTLRDLLLELGVQQYTYAMSNYHLTQANAFAAEIGIALPIPKVASPFIHLWSPTTKPAVM